MARTGRPTHPTPSRIAATERSCRRRFDAAFSEGQWRQMESGLRTVTAGQFVTVNPRPSTRASASAALGWSIDSIDRLERGEQPIEVDVGDRPGSPTRLPSMDGSCSDLPPTSSASAPMSRRLQSHVARLTTPLGRATEGRPPRPRRSGHRRSPPAGPFPRTAITSRTDLFARPPSTVVQWAAGRFGASRRRTHIELAWALLVGHRGRIDDIAAGRRRITLDARLDQVDRRAVLAHELIHDERSILFTDDTPLPLVEKRRPSSLPRPPAGSCRCPNSPHSSAQPRLDDQSVAWRDVAEWFGVPRDVAERALADLHRRRSQR